MFSPSRAPEPELPEMIGDFRAGTLLVVIPDFILNLK
jgi:hypothetical protein